MSATGPEPTPTPRRRTLRIALAVSLALNLLILGAVAGALVTRGGEMPHHAVLLDLSVGPYTRALEAEDRAALRDAWRTQAPRWQELRDAQRAELEDFVAVIRHTPFDRERIEEIMARRQARSTAQAEIAHRVLADHLQTMSHGRRAAYAERLESVARSGMRRSGPPRD
jgi:uncharacterized membrane protein